MDEWKNGGMDEWRVGMMACPGATGLQQAIVNASRWKRRLLSSNPRQLGLGQGRMEE